MLLHNDYAERLDEIKRSFGRKKLEWQKSITNAEIINASLGFVLARVNFGELSSIDDVDRYVTAQVFKTISLEGGTNGRC